MANSHRVWSRMNHFILRRPKREVPSAAERPLHDQRGVTLIELMATIAVLGILLTVAVPNMKEMARSYEVSSKANYWMNVLNFARSEASRRGQRVTLCPSGNGVSCSGSSNLHSGWIAFADTNNNATVDLGEAILKVGSVDNTYTYVLSGTANTYISFISNGMTKTIGNASWSGNIKICLEAGAPGRQVTISAVGRSKVENVGC